MLHPNYQLPNTTETTSVRRQWLAYGQLIMDLQWYIFNASWGLKVKLEQSCKNKLWSYLFLNWKSHCQWFQYFDIFWDTLHFNYYFIQKFIFKFLVRSWRFMLFSFRFSATWYFAFNKLHNIEYRIIFVESCSLGESLILKNNSNLMHSFLFQSVFTELIKCNIRW